MADKELHARIVIHDIDTMSDEDHKSLINWLHKLAHHMRVMNRKEYARKFTARLWK